MAPFHFYGLTLEEGVDSSYLKLAVEGDSMIKGGPYEWDRVDGVFSEEQKNWKLFHFQKFHLPIPVHHPYFLVVPDLQVNYDPPRLGVKMLDSIKNLRASIYTMKDLDFILNFGSHKIFNLPAFKNYILKKDLQEIWKDVFQKDLSLKGFSILDPSIISGASYKELVYNLFLLNMRKGLFPEKVKKVSYFEPKKFGIVEVEYETDSIIKDSYRVEYVYILEDGIVHRLKLKTKSFDLITEALRKRVLMQLSYKASAKEDSIQIYNEYKKLNYEQRVDQEGMIYLFAAWTHNIDNESFLREMIKFLERGNDNNIHLQPLYEFAYKKYGSNYSDDVGNRKETAQKRLERKTKEELEKEIETERKRNVENIEGSFSSDEDKIKFFLQKAKDDGGNIDDKDNVLRE
ncbi:MAG: hypothetical protein ACJAT2_001750 [Bacteriovoracaceae bacterium]|jgi:hypothetical protein